MKKYEYPHWVNFCSWLTLGLVVFGMGLMMWDVTIGAFLAALGWTGVWVFGNLATKHKKPR